MKNLVYKDVFVVNNCKYSHSKNMLTLKLTSITNKRLYHLPNNSRNIYEIRKMDAEYLQFSSINTNTVIYII